MTKILLPVFVALLMLSGAGRASNLTAAEKRVHRAVDSVLAIAERTTDAQELPARLRPVLKKSLSFEAMTRRAIGPGWRRFSAAQRKEATELFTTLIIRTYANKFTPGEHPQVTFQTATEPAPGRVEVPTKLTYQGNRYDVVYWVEAREGMRITDVIIDGVSLVANYRTQFHSLYQSGGAEAVLRSLAKTVKRSS